MDFSASLKGTLPLWQRGVFSLFQHLPDICLFAKDLELRFTLCNPALLRMLGRKRPDEVIGRRDRDIFPPHLCDMFESYDRALLRSGEPVIDHTELIRNADGSIDWYVTTKLPLRDERGTIIGLVGCTRDLKHAIDANKGFLSLDPVIDRIMTGYAENLTIPGLARLMAMSPGHFTRVFRQRFKMTPAKYIIQVRVNVACELLINSDQAISAIALDTGFFDQSHFTRNFQALKGMSPTAFRRRHRMG
jgi:PAS domain S-box-containing protein